MDDNLVPLGAVMWLQKQMESVTLNVVRDASHNIALDLDVMSNTLLITIGMIFDDIKDYLVECDVVPKTIKQTNQETASVVSIHIEQPPPEQDQDTTDTLSDHNSVSSLDDVDLSLQDIVNR